MDKNNLFLEIKTKHIKIIKDIFNLINSFMDKIYCNIIFKQGIRIRCISNDQTIISDLKLKVDNFEYFYCDRPEFNAKFDLSDCCDKIQRINHNHTYCLFIIRDNLDKLYIRNLDENQRDIIIQLFSDYQHIPMPSVILNCKITMNLKDFNDVLCDTDDVKSNLLKINVLKDSSAELSIVHLFDKIQNKSEESLIVNTYSIGAPKCLKMLDHDYHIVQLYLKQDYPLFIQIPTITSDILYISIKPAISELYLNNKIIKYNLKKKK